MNERKRYLDEMTGHGPFRLREGVERPNILFISADMVPPEFYLPGRLPMHAPNLQGMGDGHLSFANAFGTSPLCSPSRAAYLSGRHSYITTNSERAHDGHAVHLRADEVLFPEYLKAIGYHVRHVGKCHVGADRFAAIFGENDAPWDRWSPPWFDDDEYLGFLRKKGLGRIELARSISGLSLTGEGKGNDYGGWIAAQNGRPFPKEATYPAFLVEKGIKALEARTDGDRPFYLQLDFFGPHQPFAIPAGMEEREAEIRARMELPDSYRELMEADFLPPWREPRVYRMYRRNWGLRDPQTVIDYRVANQLQFELIDELIGRLFAYLKERGLYENTWIFFVADHGEMNGEQGLIDKGAFLNPRVVRVPVLLKPSADSDWGGLRRRVEEPVSLLDIAPTMLELAGVSTEARLDGVSLLESAGGKERPGEKPILFEVWSHVIPNPCVGTVFRAGHGGEHIFVFNTSDEVDELYALAGGELENLWERGGDLLDEAIGLLHRRLAADERWKSYRGFLELTYPERIAAAAGDRQLFF